jgi:hypothetical protein
MITRRRHNLTCNACRELFIAGRCDALTCSGRCRTGAYRVRNDLHGRGASLAARHQAV